MKIFFNSLFLLCQWQDLNPRQQDECQVLYQCGTETHSRIIKKTRNIAISLRILKKKNLNFFQKNSIDFLNFYQSGFTFKTRRQPQGTGLIIFFQRCIFWFSKLTFFSLINASSWSTINEKGQKYQISTGNSTMKRFRVKRTS